MKTRVKIITYGNGRTFYIAQRKRFFLFMYFFPFIGWFMFLESILNDGIEKTFWCDLYKDESGLQVKCYLKNYKSNVEKIKSEYEKRELSNKIVKKTYIKK